MSGRGGKDRIRRDYPMKSEEKSYHVRSGHPPSRHLWVGNLSHTLSEHMLADHFLQFGDLESVSFQPGRSYAFINFKHDEAAFAAVGALQGFILAGSPLRIEFAKADKSTPSHDEDYSHRRDERRDSRRDEQRASLRGSPYSQRDSRSRHSSPDPKFTNNPKMNDKSAEPPSEVLWIGFPASLRVDEGILKKAFSPFGEIEKISSFPGRTYAFIRFKNIVGACRAKEALQGKLFGNPRVHICFARSDSGSSNSGRNSMNAPPTPHTRSHGHQGSVDSFRQERYFENLPGDNRMRSPRYGVNLESEDRDSLSFDRKDNLWSGGNGPFEQRRFQERESDLGMPGNIYEHRSPPRERDAQFHDFVPQHFPQPGQYHDDEWDLPEDALLYHGAKKLKTSSFPTEVELPEYPFSDAEHVKHAVPRIPDFPHHEVHDNFNHGHFGYHRQIAEPPMNATYDTHAVSSAPLPPHPAEWRKLTPEPRQPPVQEWKWEGTIAKGGTPICRARCFPVGKVLDMVLPEILDCTARTGLDMLAKHYYQAASAWVVFFVPDTDADMGYYNEFMNYLGEKERAAVAKVDDKTTLFLVPPSEFSEKVLKVPGKLSISGVILRLEQPTSSMGSHLHPSEIENTHFTSFPREAPIISSIPKQISPSRPYPPTLSFPVPGKSRVSTSLPVLPTTTSQIAFPGSAHADRTMLNSSNDKRQESMSHQHGLPNHLQNLSSGGRNLTAETPVRANDPMVSHYNSAMPRTMQETSSSNYYGGPGVPIFGGSGNLPHHEAKPAASSSMALQQDQLALLASTLLGNSRQSGASGITMAGDFRQLNTTIRPPDNFYIAPQKYPAPNNQVNSELPSSQYGQVQQFQPQPPISNFPPMPQRELSTSGQGSGTQDDGDADPQKRLQATLQLAAALLQQIQQGKGS